MKQQLLFISGQGGQGGQDDGNPQHDSQPHDDSFPSIVAAMALPVRKRMATHDSVT
jgi:hypothetical protein